MPSGRLLAVVLLAALLPAACGRPPDKEMNEARLAIEAAQTEGAERYAAEEFTAARDALARAADAVTERDYQLALNNALDSRERAQTAARQAAETRAAARADGEAALADADRAVTEARQAIAAAEPRRPAASAVAGAREALAAAERALQEARAAAATDDWLAVRAALEPATTALTAAIADLAPATGPSSGRRRR